MPRRIPAFFAAFLCSLVLALPSTASAETLFWPATGRLRECPEFMDVALYPDMHAGNTVIIQGDVPGDVAGAVAYKPLMPPRNDVEMLALASAIRRGNGTARHNTVLLQRGVVEGFVDGGWSSMGPAQDNILIVSGGTVRKLARGGGSNGGPAQGNVLHMLAGSVEGSAIGGSSLRDAASGNTLTFSGGAVRDAVVGGSSSFGPAESNTVHMNGGRASSVVGGSSAHGNVQGNTVHVWSGVVTRDIVGGETTNGELTTQNTVILDSRAQLAPEVRVFGGLKISAPGSEPGPAPAPIPASPAKKTLGKKTAPPSALPQAPSAGRDEFLFKGNVLKMGWQGRLRGVHNFQYWEFYLPETLRPGETLLTVDEEVDLRQCVLRLVRAEPGDAAAALPAEASAWQPGDSAVLLRAPALLTEGVSLPPVTLTTTPMTHGRGQPITGQPISSQRHLEFTLTLDDAQRPTAVILTLTRVRDGAAPPTPASTPRPAPPRRPAGQQ